LIGQAAGGSDGGQDLPQLPARGHGGFALALFGELKQSFPPENLFMDVEGGIKAGQDFVRVIEEQVRACDAMLVLIGPNWLTVKDETGRSRLETPHDFVRIEVSSALGFGKRVIPVLVQKAEMPGAGALPEPLKALARRNAVRLTHERFRADAQGLVKALQDALAVEEAAKELFEIVTLEVSQSTFAKYIARSLGVEDKLTDFVFFEETGDLDPDRSRLVLRGDIHVKFEYNNVINAEKLFVSDVGRELLDRGLAPTCWVIEGFKARWNSNGKGAIPKKARMLCVMETKSLNVSGISSEILSRNLIRYAYALPEDSDRSFLNSLPNSPASQAVLDELIRREESRELLFALDNIASLRPGISVMWACEIIKARSTIKDQRLKRLVEKSQPPDPNNLRSWGKNFIERLFDFIRAAKVPRRRT
jgi:hypothetical protein